MAEVGIYLNFKRIFFSCIKICLTQSLSCMLEALCVLLLEKQPQFGAMTQRCLSGLSFQDCYNSSGCFSFYFSSRDAIAALSSWSSRKGKEPGYYNCFLKWRNGEPKLQIIIIDSVTIVGFGWINEPRSNRWDAVCSTFPFWFSWK